MNDSENVNLPIPQSRSTDGLCMSVGVRYKVTKESDDGTFRVGDHITLHTDGTIGCREASGWIEQPDVEEAIVGMKVEIDQEWAKRRKAKLLEELAALDV